MKIMGISWRSWKGSGRRSDWAAGGDQGGDTVEIAEDGWLEVVEWISEDMEEVANVEDISRRSGKTSGGDRGRHQGDQVEIMEYVKWSFNNRQRLWRRSGRRSCGRSRWENGKRWKDGLQREGERCGAQQWTCRSDWKVMGCVKSADWLSMLRNENGAELSPLLCCWGAADGIWMYVCPYINSDMSNISDVWVAAVVYGRLGLRW